MELSRRMIIKSILGMAAIPLGRNFFTKVAIEKPAENDLELDAYEVHKLGLAGQIKTTLRRYAEPINGYINYEPKTEDITARCRYASEKKGIAILYKRNEQGAFYVDWTTNDAAKETIGGIVQFEIKPDATAKAKQTFKRLRSNKLRTCQNIKTA